MQSTDLCFPDGASGKEPSCQCRRHKRCGFDPWVRKIPWNRKWEPTPVFLPGESHGQRSLANYSPWGLEESDSFFFLSLALGERSRVQRPKGQDTRETRAQEHWRQGSYKVLAKSAHSGEDRRAFTPRNSVPFPPSAPMTEHEVSLCPALPPGQGGALPIRPNM